MRRRNNNKRRKRNDGVNVMSEETTYKGHLKSYLTKTHRIKELIKFDYHLWLNSEECLIIKRVINNKTFYFNPKDKEPYRSFSSLTNSLYGSHIPEFALKKAAEYGNNLMDNIENWYLSFGEMDLIGNEKDKKIFETFLKFLVVEELKIVSVEKFFINEKTKEYGFVDLFVKNKKGEIILIEIKTRNDLIVSNVSRAQAFFYKKNFENVKTWILQINRKNYDYVVDKFPWQWGFKSLKVIKLFHNEKEWIK